MIIKQFFYVVFLLLLSLITVNGVVFCKKEESLSFLLFVLDNSHITIERYTFDELNRELCHLSTSMREGHTLFNIDMNTSNEYIENIFFNPFNPQELILIAKKDEQPTSYLFLWTPLITKYENLPYFDGINFSVKKLQDDRHCIAVLHGQCEEENELSFGLHLDCSVAGACAVFLEDKNFSYDRGLFTRELSKKQVKELALLHDFSEDENKALSPPQKQSLLTGIGSYVVSRWKAFREYFSKRLYKNELEKALEQSFEAEDKFDKLLEDAMNSDLDFVPENKMKESSAFVRCFKGAGIFLFMRYLTLEQKMRDLWGVVARKEYAS